MAQQNSTPEQSRRVPKLRFPEFEREWKENILGKIAAFSKGKGISKNDISFDGINECIRYGELYTDYSEIIRNIKSKTNVEKSNAVLSEENDIIIPSSGETAIDIATASCVLKSDVILGGDLNIIKTNNNGVFLSYYLNNKKKTEIASLSQGNAVVHLYSKQLATLSLNLPTLPEQQKIADFLSEVDGKLQLLQRKKELLETYKKGMMQQLFTQQLRFKDGNGNNFPDWEEKRLGEVCDIRGGGTPPTTNSDYWNGEIQWFTPTEVKSRFVSKSVRTISNEGLKNSSAKLLPKGTILLTTRATIGDCSITLNECTTNQGFQSLIVNELNNNHFIYYWVLMNKNAFIKKANGSTFLEISKSQIETLDFLKPCLKEQTKIAEFLSAIDSKIDSVTHAITHTQQFKKGLLQQLFV